MRKAPTRAEKFKKQRDNNKKRLQKLLTIADRLMTVIWSNAATQLVWLNRLMGSQPFHSPQQLCNRRHELADTFHLYYFTMIWMLMSQVDI